MFHLIRLGFAVGAGLEVRALGRVFLTAKTAMTASHAIEFKPDGAQREHEVVESEIGVASAGHELFEELVLAGHAIKVVDFDESANPNSSISTTIGPAQPVPASESRP